jgi:hypothetical protein
MHEKIVFRQSDDAHTKQGNAPGVPSAVEKLHVARKWPNLSWL